MGDDHGTFLVYNNDDGKLTVKRFNELMGALQFMSTHAIGKKDYALVEGELIRGRSLSDKLRAKRYHDGDAADATRRMLSRGPMLTEVDDFDEDQEDDEEDDTYDRMP